jgi:hypothetical protein
LAAVEPTAEVAPPVAPTAEAPPTDVPTVEPIFEPTRTISPEEIEDDIDFAGEATATHEPTRAVSPDALAPSIGWGGLGGGGEDCPTDLVGPEFYIFATGGGYLPGDADNDLTIGGHVYLSGCAFPALEWASYAFYLPDGRVDSGEILIDEFGYWEVRWWSVPGEPLGEYIFEFYSSLGVHSANFVVFSPTESLISYDCSPYEVTVILIGFQPGEEVLLGRYANESGDNLIDYGYFTIGPDGTAIFTLPREDVLLIAIGQNTRPQLWQDANGNDITVSVSASGYLLCAFLE